MRHETEHGPGSIVDACDIALRAVRVCVAGQLARRFAVAEGDEIFTLQAVKRFAVRIIVSVMMGDGNADHLTLVISAGEVRIVAFNLEEDVLAHEFERGVAHQHARQKAGLGQQVKPVADAEHRRTGIRFPDHVPHDRRVGRHCAGAQIITV